jgi:hypothetical protein
MNRQPLQANSSVQDEAPGKLEPNALLQLFAQDNKIADECVNQCLVKLNDGTLDQVLCCLWHLPIYRSERHKLAEWLLHEGKMSFRCPLAECMCLKHLKSTLSKYLCPADDRPVNEREIMSDIPKLWVDELNKTKLDTTQKRKIKEQFAIMIMSNRIAQQSAINGYKRPGDPKPPANERPGLFRPTEAELKKGYGKAVQQFNQWNNKFVKELEKPWVPPLMPWLDESTQTPMNQIKLAAREMRVPAATIFATAAASKTSFPTSAKPPQPKGPTIPTIQAINRYPNPLLFQPHPIKRPSVPVYSPTGSGSLLPPTQGQPHETVPLGKKQSQEDVKEEEHDGGKKRAASPSPSDSKDSIHAAVKKMKISPHHPSTSNAFSASSSRQTSEYF